MCDPGTNFNENISKDGTYSYGSENESSCFEENFQELKTKLDLVEDHLRNTLCFEEDIKSIKKQISEFSEISCNEKCDSLPEKLLALIKKVKILENRIVTISGDLDELSGEQSTTQNKVNNNSDKISLLEISILDTIPEEIRKINTAIEKIKENNAENFKSITATIAKYFEKFNSLSGDIDEVKVTTSTGFNDVNEEIEKIKEQLNNLPFPEEITELKNSFFTLNALIKRLDTQYGEVNTKVIGNINGINYLQQDLNGYRSENENNIQSINTEIANLATKAHLLQDDLATSNRFLANKIQSLMESQNEDDVEINDNEEKIKELMLKSEDIAAKIDSITGKINDLDPQVTSNSAELTEQEKTLASLQNHLETIANEFGNMQSTFNVDINNLEALKEELTTNGLVGVEFNYKDAIDELERQAEEARIAIPTLQTSTEENKSLIEQIDEKLFTNTASLEEQETKVQEIIITLEELTTKEEFEQFKMNVDQQINELTSSEEFMQFKEAVNTELSNRVTTTEFSTFETNTDDRITALETSGVSTEITNQLNELKNSDLIQEEQITEIKNQLSSLNLEELDAISDKIEPLLALLTSGNQNSIVLPRQVYTENVVTNKVFSMPFTGINPCKVKVMLGNTEVPLSATNGFMYSIISNTIKFKVGSESIGYIMDSSGNLTSQTSGTYNITLY